MGNRIRRQAIGWLAITAVAIGMLSAPAPAAAKDGDIIRSGRCTANSTWKLKLSPENGRIEVEFEVDQNRNYQTWNVKLKKNGNVFWRGQRTTQPPSGSFEVRKLTNNGAGSDLIVARAVNPKTGEICKGKATF